MIIGGSGLLEVFAVHTEAWCPLLPHLTDTESGSVLHVTKGTAGRFGIWMVVQ